MDTIIDLATARPEALEVLDFWIGPAPHDADWLAQRQPLWFRSDPELDAAIRERFATRVDQAAAGQLDAWAEAPADWLALLILLDQFPRNLFRGSPQAFAADPLAVATADEGIARGFDAQLALPLRLFCYLPFEHAEDVAAQQRSVALFEALLADAPDEFTGIVAGWLDYARRHAEPIARFGRFPHRNAVLGRTSSEAERAWLEQHPGGF